MMKRENAPTKTRRGATDPNKAPIAELIRLFTEAKELCANLPKKNPKIWQKCREAVRHQPSWDDELRGILRIPAAVGAIHTRERSQDGTVCFHDILSAMQQFTAPGPLPAEDIGYRLLTDGYYQFLAGNCLYPLEEAISGSLDDPILYDLALIPYCRQDPDYPAACTRVEEEFGDLAKNIDHALAPLLPTFDRIARIRGTLLTADWPRIRRGSLVGKMLRYHDEDFLARAIDELELLLEGDGLSQVSEAALPANGADSAENEQPAEPPAGSTTQVEDESGVGDTESNILTAVGKEHMTGRVLLQKAGYEYSGYYRGILSNLKKRGLLAHDKTGYYRRKA